MSSWVVTNWRNQAVRKMKMIPVPDVSPTYARTRIHHFHDMPGS